MTRFSLLLIFLVHSAVSACADYVAYNDCGWATGESTGNISTGSPAAQLSCTLVDHSSGAPVGAMATFSGGASSFTYPVDLPPGSDAATVFSGNISCSNYAFSATTVTLSISGLNPIRSYSLVLFSTRGSGAEKYSNRWTDVTISSVDLFTNNSSSGSVKLTVTASNDTTRIVSANMNGRVVRYDAVHSGLDGSLTLTLTPGATNAETPTVYLEAFMVQEFNGPAGTEPRSALDVRGGSLRISGRLATPLLNVGSAGSLKGTGLMSGDLSLSGSVIPGLSTGQVTGLLTIDGNVAFLPGSRYYCDVTSTDNADTLFVGDSVTGSCEIWVTPTNGASPMQLTILHAATNGNFSAFSSGGPHATNWTLTSAGNDLRLSDGITDADTNSIPDWWEFLYFGGRTNATAGNDTDNDGLTEHDEYIAGTNPTNALSLLGIDAVGLSASNTIIMSWPSTAGRTYAIVKTTNLMTTAFSTIVTNILATPPANNITLGIPAGTKEFYNVRVRKE